MKLGFHISIMGGFRNVLTRAKRRNCETIQIFSRNPRGWKYKDIDEEDSQVFKKQIRDSNIAPIFVHLPYLINLGSHNNELFNKSIASLTADLIRTEKLGARYLITHSGSNQNVKAGIKRMVKAIIQAFVQVDNDVVLLVENTAGSGNEFGHKFEQLKEILDGVGSDRIGIVFDTAHAFEAGYELRTKKGVDETISRLERIIGIERVHLVHFNDSRTKIGSKRDRHWHIGKGEIGRGMKFIINHSALRHLPFIMETPRTDTKEDLVNMSIARKMIKNS
ncbi:MAG: deoxyribonuclease IV [bacterium]